MIAQEASVPRWVHGHVLGLDHGRGQWGRPGEARSGLTLFVEESIEYPEVHVRRCRCGGGQVDRGGIEGELHQERAHHDGMSNPKGHKTSGPGRARALQELRARYTTPLWVR